MTDEEINTAVARKLGWRQNVQIELGNAKWYREGDISSCVVPADYCRSIEAAWEIVDKQNYCYLFKLGDGTWECKLTFADKRSNYGIAPTAPMAICKAFLKLNNEEVPA